jgi:two-component system OmpR family response regulator
VSGGSTPLRDTCWTRTARRSPSAAPVFVDHPQRVLNRDQLLNLTQGRDAELFDRSIDLMVSRLRQRLGDDAREPVYIKTVRSEGYVLSVPVGISELRQ